MQQGPTYCTSCGMPIQRVGKACPHCGEPLPAPPTVPGYAEPERMAPQPPPPPPVQPVQPPMVAPAVVPSPLAVTPFPPVQPPGTAEQQPLPQVIHGHAPAAQPLGVEVQPPAPFVPQPFVISPIVPQGQGTPQIRDLSPIESAATLPAGGALEQAGPADTRKGRTWRTIVGGGMLTWGILLGIVSTTFVVAHVTIIAKSGWANVHGAVVAMLWVSIAMLLAASLEAAAGAVCLRGGPSPRASVSVATVAQIVWSVVAISVMANQLSSKDGPALRFEVLVGVSVLPTIAFGILALAAGKWLWMGPPGRRPSPVSYRTWGPPLVMVLAALTLLRLAIPVLIVLVAAAGKSKIRYEADDYFYATQPFWGAVVACVLCGVLIAASVGLLRGKRWSLFAGAGVGVISLLLVIAIPLLVLVQNDTYDLGGTEHLPMLAWTCLVHGAAAWVALGGAIGLRFRLPSATV